MNRDTGKKIQEHAQISGDALRVHLEQIENRDRFLRCFHLRPTSEGVTIVSTLPSAPMRGVKVPAEPSAIMDRLTRMERALPLLLSEREDHEQQLRELGFAKRSNRNPLEDDLQARFIRGMIDGEPAYQGIRFVASELTLGDGQRFDVVGAKEGTLYLFELKRSRTATAAAQVKAYCSLVQAHKDTFEQVLSVYPNNAVSKISAVKGIAVMCYAENSPLKSWEDWQVAARNLEASNKYDPDISGVDIWLYQTSRSLQKLPALTE